MKNKLSSSTKSLTCLSVPKRDGTSHYIFNYIFTYSLQAVKNKETGLLEISMIARKQTNFPERLKWWKAWCLVERRILWELLWVAKGQHPGEAASAKCRVQGVKEEWDRKTQFEDFQFPSTFLTWPFLFFYQCMGVTLSHNSLMNQGYNVTVPTNKILEKPVVTHIPATKPPQILIYKFAEGWQPHWP